MDFWTSINHGLDKIAQDRLNTFAAVKEILDRFGNPDATEHSGQTFFAGSGGDRTQFGALSLAGWRRSWSEADYYYIAVHPLTGEAIEYVEGDVYQWNGEAVRTIETDVFRWADARVETTGGNTYFAAPDVTPIFPTGVDGYQPVPVTLHLDKARRVVRVDPRTETPGGILAREIIAQAGRTYQTQYATDAHRIAWMLTDLQRRAVGLGLSWDEITSDAAREYDESILARANS